MDEVGNEDKNKHTTSRDSSEPVNLVTAEKHTESPTTEPKSQLSASDEEARHHLLYCLIHTQRLSSIAMDCLLGLLDILPVPHHLVYTRVGSQCPTRMWWHWLGQDWLGHPTPSHPEALVPPFHFIPAGPTIPSHSCVLLGWNGTCWDIPHHPFQTPWSHHPSHPSVPSCYACNGLVCTL